MISYSERLNLIQRAFGKCLLGKDGVNASIRCLNRECPSRSDPAKLKLVVRVDTEQYHCWVCGMKGKNVAPLFSKYAPSYLQDAKEIFRRLPHTLFDGTKNEPEPRVELPHGFSLLVNEMSSKDPDVRAVFHYLHGRGIEDCDLWKMRLGTCVDGKYRRRVIFPSLDAEGDVNYWVARSIDSHVDMRYINAKADKKKIIFNECDIDFSKEVTLVEGPFDLIKCDENATCLLGSSLSCEQPLYFELARHETPVLLALDSDMKVKTQKIAKMLHSSGCNVKILPLESFSDVGEMSKNDFKRLKAKARIWNPIDSLTQKILSIKSGSIL